MSSNLGDVGEIVASKRLPFYSEGLVGEDSEHITISGSGWSLNMKERCRTSSLVAKYDILKNHMDCQFFYSDTSVNVNSSVSKFNLATKPFCNGKIFDKFYYI